MRRTILFAVLFITTICGATGYKYRRVITKEVNDYRRNSSAMNQGNSRHIKEGSCIAKMNRLNLPQKKLSKLSSITGLKHVASGESYHVGAMKHSKPLLTKKRAKNSQCCGQRLPKTPGGQRLQKEKNRNYLHDPIHRIPKTIIEGKCQCSFQIGTPLWFDI